MKFCKVNYYYIIGRVLLFKNIYNAVEIVCCYVL